VFPSASCSTLGNPTYQSLSSSITLFRFINLSCSLTDGSCGDGGTHPQQGASCHEHQADDDLGFSPMTYAHTHLGCENYDTGALCVYRQSSGAENQHGNTEAAQ
jgi:hypothetical protein